MSKDPTIGAGFVGGDESAKITGVVCSALSEGDEWETLIRHPAVLYSLSGLVMSCPLMNRLITHLPVLFYFLLWVSSGLDSDFLGWATNVPVELCGS